MRVSPEVIAKYGLSCDSHAGSGVPDADAAAFFGAFDEPEGAKVLLAGCHDECVANILAEAGFDVVGFDLREYEESLPRCNYRFVCGDFCQMPPPFVARYEGKFDAFVSLSSIEHFGLGTYGEPFYNPYYDRVALRTAGRMTTPTASAYVTVPYGKKFLSHGQHWRVYDEPAVVERLVAGFTEGGVRVGCAFFTSAEAVVGGEAMPVGRSLTKEQADGYEGDPPHVTILLKITKTQKEQG